MSRRVTAGHRWMAIPASGASPGWDRTRLRDRLADIAAGRLMRALDHPTPDYPAPDHPAPLALPAAALDDNGRI